MVIRDVVRMGVNREKHGLFLDEVKQLFTRSVEFLEIYDEGHSDAEDRFTAIGPIQAGMVVVIYTERGEDVVRVLSARKATKRSSSFSESAMRTSMTSPMAPAPNLSRMR
jgi:uncharacterized DUF497 family protein